LLNKFPIPSTLSGVSIVYDSITSFLDYQYVLEAVCAVHMHHHRDLG
jgi:hypothetical protein